MNMTEAIEACGQLRLQRVSQIAWQIWRMLTGQHARSRKNLIPMLAGRPGLQLIQDQIGLWRGLMDSDGR